MQAPAQRGERDRPAQLARCSRGQEEAPPGRLAGGVAEQRGLADTRLPFHQQYAAHSPLGALEQAAGHHLFGPASVQHFPAGPSLRRHRAARGPGALIIAVVSRFAEVSDHRSGPPWAAALIEARVCGAGLAVVGGICSLLPRAGRNSAGPSMRSGYLPAHHC
jgi:hypothetical protein